MELGLKDGNMSFFKKLDEEYKFAEKYGDILNKSGNGTSTKILLKVVKGVHSGLRENTEPSNRLDLFYLYKHLF
jgi:hypothetical protein